MFTSPGPIPKGAVFFAYQIADRFGLNRTTAIDFIQKAIVAALRDQETTQRARELVACAQCGILLSRYACVLERFGTCCPQCRNPMAAPDILYLKRIAELEEKLRRFEGDKDSSPEARFRQPRTFEMRLVPNP
jgi:hypothetical protein